MKKKRPELIDIEIESLTNEGKQGSFAVNVYNGTDSAVKHTIGINCTVPLLIMHAGKILNKKKRPSTFVESRIVTIPLSTTKQFVFHWIDPDPRTLKCIGIVAKFMHVKSEEISFI